MSKRSWLVINKKWLVVTLGIWVFLWAFYRWLSGRPGTSHRYNVKSFEDYQRIFPHAFRPVDADGISAPRADSSGELRCRAYLERVLSPHRFPKRRPAFMKNPITQADLELDCYNEQLALAVEYQGAQHYSYTPHFHASRDAFHNQRYRDDIKRNLCLKNGITLIEVPYSCRHIESFLKSELTRLGFLLVKDEPI